MGQVNTAARRRQFFSVARASIDKELFTTGNFFKSATHWRKL
jgi:hypothetical protein